MQKLLFEQLQQVKLVCVMRRVPLKMSNVSFKNILAKKVVAKKSFLTVKRWRNKHEN